MLKKVSIHVHNDCIQEVFVDLIEVERITGEALETAILNHLAKWKLPLVNLCGQCFKYVACAVLAMWCT